LDKDALRVISAEGGRTAHALGKAHRFTSAEAREAGKKGGARSGEKRRKAVES